jgi:hypothetical protein
MYNPDGLLNGEISRQHFQDRIREAQQDRFARDVAAAQKQYQAISPMHALLVRVIHLIGVPCLYLRRGSYRFRLRHFVSHGF